MSRILCVPALAGALLLAGGVPAAPLQDDVERPVTEPSRLAGLDTAVAARTELPAPLGGPAIKADEALVTISYQSFRYEAVVVLKGEPRVISGQVSSALGRYDAQLSPGAAGYSVVLRSAPSRSGGIAGWSIDTSTGTARCTRSPRYERALGRMSVHNARGRRECGL